MNNKALWPMITIIGTNFLVMKHYCLKEHWCAHLLIEHIIFFLLQLPSFFQCILFLRPTLLGVEVGHLNHAVLLVAVEQRHRCIRATVWLSRKQTVTTVNITTNSKEDLAQLLNCLRFFMKWPRLAETHDETKQELGSTHQQSTLQKKNAITHST